MASDVAISGYNFGLSCDSLRVGGGGTGYNF